MDMFSIVMAVVALLGGLAMFLYGMSVMGQSLEKVAGGKLEKILAQLTNSRMKAVLLGTGVTAVIQSSSAVTVMVVGFVNSGILKLSQAVGVIMGANIGTTVTSWMLSLVGLEGENVFIQMLKPDFFAPLLGVAGIILIMATAKGKRKDVGTILVGFTILMAGMATMSDAVDPIAEIPEFQNMLVAFQNPLLGVLVGAVVTAVIQSSSASVGILQVLATTGKVTYGAGIPIIMGQNIGTCVTALLSCVGANKNAKRAAMVHLYFNLIGSALFLGVYCLGDAVFDFAFTTQALSPSDIAIIHSIFNVTATAILLPCAGLLEKMAVMTVREKSEAQLPPLLDERLLMTPAFAVEQSRNVTNDMMDLTRSAMMKALDNLEKWDDKTAEAVAKLESDADRYEDRLGSYLVNLSAKNLNDQDSRLVAMLLHSIGDLERVSDHALNIVKVAEEMKDKGISFSEEARGELIIMADSIREILTLTVDSFVRQDVTMAARVEPLEQVVDDLKSELRARHIRRLQKGNCTIELGFIFSDLLTNYERVSDHCSNLAVAMIELQETDNFDSHEYLKAIKNTNSP